MTILSILRENLSFDKQYSTRILVPRSPICKMCAKDIGTAYMRLYNYHYEETVYTCSQRCYLAFMQFYNAIGDSKRETEKRKQHDKQFTARFKISYDVNQAKRESTLWEY